MHIYINRGNLHNRGDELMLRAITRHFRSRSGFFLVGDDKPKIFEKRMQLGLYYTRLPLPEIRRFGRLLRYWILRRYRRSLGLLLDREIQAVLDVSGFGHGDQWGEEFTARTADKYMQWKKYGLKIIMLPQAFGPFSNPRIRDDFRRMILASDLVYARDTDSYEFAVDITGDRPHIRIAPDITHLVPGLKPSEAPASTRTAYIVPNSKFLSHVSPEISKVYIPFLAGMAEELRSRDILPKVLLHEDKRDLLLLDSLREKIRERTGHEPEVVSDPDPEKLKGILGTAFLVVGSRFHSLVSSLSQGVPCLGTGWSHKYQRLFEEYGISDYLVSPLDEPAEIRRKLDGLTSEPSRTALIPTIADAAERNRLSVIAMWEEVDRLLAADARR